MKERNSGSSLAVPVSVDWKEKRAKKSQTQPCPTGGVLANLEDSPGNFLTQTSGK